MAEKLVKYYKYIFDLKGASGKYELAKLTAMPSIIVGTEPDSPENIKKFEEAIAKLTGKPAPKLL